MQTLRKSPPPLIVLLTILIYPPVPLPAHAQQPASQPRFDFETGDLQGWTVVEGGFGLLVSDMKEFRNHPGTPYNKQGTYYLSTVETKNYRGNDGFTGVVRSPGFAIRADHLSFLVGGGSGEGVCVGLSLAEDGTLVRVARGERAEKMRRHIWDVRDLRGKQVYLVLIDRETGGWGHITFDDFREPTAEELADLPVDAAAPSDPEALKRILRTPIERVKSLRRAVEDFHRTYADRYPAWERFLAELEFIERAIASAAPDRRQAAVADLEALARQAFVASPLLGDAPLLFVVRQQYLRDHHNTATIFQTGEINTGSFRGGGALKTIDLRTDRTETLLDVPEGIVRDPDVSFDGERVLFSMRRNPEDDYHIYEMSADGTGLRQLTFGGGVSDIDPLYLPDGRIAFTSTREPKYCMCNRHIMGNLFRMEADGANIHQIGKSTLFEGHGNLMPDGRILYDRWEYVDRNFGDAQGLWTCNPDGTEHAVYWGNNTPSPGAVLEGRIVPGTDRVLTIFSSCHDRPWGALALVDRRLGVDGREPVLRTWPASAIDRVMRGNWDAFVGINPKYEDPYPLTDRHFLCSRMTGAGEEMGIYLVDVFGNEVLLHAGAPGCFDPMPLGPRERPPLIPDRVDLAQSRGYFYVHDVYVGTGMEAVERGAVKYLRVVESPEKRFWTHPSWPGQGQEAPAMNWHDFNNKRILGTVPVDADGSAYFAVPADRFVYFQLLDADGLMVQSMRSGVTARPGETTGCIGCHEERTTGLPVGETKQAYSRPPQDLQPWYGEPRLFSYAAEVQPVFDRSCLRCHDFGQAGAEKLNLAGDRGLAFNRSYNELWRKGYIHVVGAGPADIQKPYSWGSHASKLLSSLRSSHKRGDLDEEGFDRIVTWIDLNAPYYPTYASAYPGSLYGRSPLTREQLARLGELAGIDFLDGKNDYEDEMQISFDRPELSPCLASLEPGEPSYTEALAIVRAGADLLAQRPRADMPGFTPASVDVAREEKYRGLQSLAEQVLQGMLAGERVYPFRPDPPGQ
jgi:hypothetical protein